MQVDRQPSPWPCAAMLVGLLLLCLAVPLYWRHEAPLAELLVNPAPLRDRNAQRSPLGTELSPFGVRGANLPGPSINFSSGFMLDNDFLSLFAPPTIEELIAARAGMPRFDEGLIGWPTFEPASTTREADRAPSKPTQLSAAVPGPRVTATLDRVGRAIVEYSPAELLPRFAANVVTVYRRWSSEPVALSNELRVSSAEPAAPALSTLRIVDVDDPTTMAPQEPPQARIASDPWCVPQLLFEQLQRLARHPYSARWAEQTIAELHALTERDRLEGDDVQTILADLSDSAQEAVRMAEETAEDRLRVELLRAHWALARRLDRWTIVHEIRVAARSGNRLADRRSLAPYFEGLPSGSIAPTDNLTLRLEAYEQTRDPQFGRQIVGEQRTLEKSADSLDRALADAVEQHYRNANVRVAVSAAMLNRYLGQERSEVRALRERIAGAEVRGQSHTKSTSRVRLDPATGRWELDVEAEGVVESNISADGGPARFRSRSATDFAARKRVVVDSDGILLQPTSIDVASHNRLVGVTTDFDWVPLMGSYARDRAVQQYRARQSRARAEVESRVSAQAVEHLDKEARDAVERIEKRVRERFTDRLAEFGVQVTPIEMTTTHQRVVARLRVASDEQPASHTPRPRALSDSLASVQVHETALSNTAVSLELDGRRYTAPELQAMFRERFPQMARRELSESADDTVFQFADRDALQVHIGDGRIEVTLSLSSVQQDGRTMREFVVHAYYVPVVKGLEAELTRDGVLGIEGRLSSAERARLHNVFNSVLPPERRLPIVRLDDPADPRLAGLMITQLVLEDGWLGLSVGPATSERVAERSRSLR